MSSDPPPPYPGGPSAPLIEEKNGQPGNATKHADCDESQRALTDHWGMSKPSPWRFKNSLKCYWEKTYFF